MTLEEAKATAHEVVKVIQTGNIVEKNKRDNVENIRISDGKHTAVLIKPNGSWLLTGWKDNNVADVIGKGDDNLEPTHNKPTPTRLDMGATTEESPSKINVP